MHMHHSSKGFTLSERRLCHLMPPGPEGAERLQPLVQHERSKDVMNDPSKRAEINVAERAGAAAGAVDVARGHINHVIVHEYQHLTAAPGATPPGRGMTPEQAIREINTMLTNAGIRLFRAEADPTATPPIKTINAPAGAPPAAPRAIPARYNAVPGVPDLLNALPVDQRNAIVDTLATLDTDAAQRQVEAFMTSINGLTPARQQMVIQRLLTGTYPPGRTAEDNRALTPVEAMIADPRNAINRIASALRAAITAPTDASEAPEKARSILNGAREAYRTAKTRFEGDRSPKNEAEMIYIREKAMGQLMLMGIDVSNEEGLLTTTPMPRVEMLQVTQQWEMILHKFMGAMRLAMAVVNKVKGKLPEANPGPTGGAPENTPERLKTGGIDKLKAKGPLVAKVPPGTPIDNADPNNTVYKFTKGAVNREYRFNGTEWQVKKGPTDADWTKNTADAGVLIVGAGTPPAALTPDQTEINTFTRDILTVPAAPGAAPTINLTPEQKNALRTKTDEEYNKVAGIIRGPGGPGALKLEEIAAALAAITAEKAIPNPPAGSPDVATHAARVADIGNKEFELKCLQKYVDVHAFYKQNVTLATERTAAINARDTAKIRDVAGRIVTMNELELAKLKEKVDGKDLATTDLTKPFIGGSEWSPRVQAIEAALPIYRAEVTANLRRFDIADANKENRRVEGAKLFANSAALGVAGITDDDWIGDDVQNRGGDHWAIDIDGRQDSGDWLHVKYVGDHWEHGLAAGKDGDTGGMRTDTTYASTGNDSGTRQANEIIGKLKALEDRFPTDPAKVPA